MRLLYIHYIHIHTTRASTSKSDNSYETQPIRKNEILVYWGGKFLLMGHNNKGFSRDDRTLLSAHDCFSVFIISV